MSDLPGQYLQTNANCKKILGDQAKIPQGKISVINQRTAEHNKVFAGFQAAIKPLEKKIAELRAALSEMIDAYDQADGDISNDSYGLDPKKPEDKKKIQSAQALFSKFFKDAAKELGGHLTDVKELDKHVLHLDSYKGPK